jgi:hypothetical protein
MHAVKEEFVWLLLYIFVKDLTNVEGFFCFCKFELVKVLSMICLTIVCFICFQLSCASVLIGESRPSANVFATYSM